MYQPQSTESERLLHKGSKFDFAVVSRPGRSGAMIDREVVRHPGAVLIIGLRQGVTHQEEEVILVRQHRVALGSEVLEFPAGTMEPGEDPCQCAAREFREETGYVAATLEAVGRFYPSPGMSDEIIHVFFATGLSFVDQALEDDEAIEVRRVPVSMIKQLVQTGELVDGKSLTSLLLAVSKGKLSQQDVFRQPEAT